MSLDQDRRNKSYRLQVAGVWIGGAGLVVALFRAVFDLWNVVGR
jgi:hypothetical protein